MKGRLQSKQWTNCVTEGGSIVKLRTQLFDPPPPPLPTRSEGTTVTYTLMGSNGQRGPSCYLRVENRANTQGQYRRVTKGLCAKYHWGCVCARMSVTHATEQAFIIPFK